jgi:wyosine [tRNA(Phe)-imidazoG37] synthetase (radical SAM superfamily)
MSTNTNTIAHPEFLPVYGPVKSWRYGRSLGIDPIGKTSICSFNCVYCQLGEIEKITAERKVYVTTEQIKSELMKFAPWDVDIVTLSGSGEPTLALNLGEILQTIKELTHKPILVLTNATLLDLPEVRKDLVLADRVAVKIDAVDDQHLQGANRPAEGITLENIWAGIQAFQQTYTGILSVQTMILSAWNEARRSTYIDMMKTLQPDEIQLNTPTRPKPINRQLDGRENHGQNRPYAVQQLHCVSGEYLHKFATEITDQTGIKVRYVSHNHK